MYKILLSEDDFLRYLLFNASQSKMVKKQRLRSRIISSLVILVLGVVFSGGTLGFMLYYCLGISVLMFIFYPVYERGQYKKHFQKYIKENFQHRIGIENTVSFEDGYISVHTDSTESKIKISEISEVNEIADNIFVKLKTGESLIVPAKDKDFQALKEVLQKLASSLNIHWNHYPDWKWK